MKNIFTPSVKYVAVSVLVFLPCFTVLAEQREFTDSQNVVYTYDTDGSIASVKEGYAKTGGIEDYGGSPYASGAIVIPNQIKIDGKLYDVTQIGDYAFYCNEKIISVKVSEGISVIGKGSFNGCSDITRIELPQSLVTIKEDAFMHCEKLQTISIPNNIQSLGKRTFSCCYNLNNVLLPSGLLSIGESAFNACSSLSSIIIPKSVRSIVIGSSSGPFDGCTALESIVVEEGNNVYDSRSICNAIIKTADNELIVGCKNTVIPESVTSLARRSFSGTEITGIVIPASVKRIKDRAFSNCKKLISIEIPEGVECIEECCFYGCESLATIVLPKSLTGIEGYAFEYCSSLSVITLPQNLTTIGNGAFIYCNQLSEINILGSVKSIGNSAFSNCGIENFAFPEGLETIGSSAFSGCRSLKSVNFPESLNSIGASAFSGCYKITKVSMPAGVREIGSRAFFNTSLTEVTSNIEEPFEIDESVFSTGGRFTSAPLYVPVGSKEKYRATSGWNKFYPILEIGSEGGVGEYIDSNTGVVYQYESDSSTAVVKKGTNSEAGSPNATGDIYILEKIEVGGKVYIVTRIDDYAFYGCTGLTSVDVPQTVTSINQGAFMDCGSLETVTMTENVTYIGASAFGFTRLKSIELPPHITAIEDETFYGCMELEEIIIPSSVEHIGNYVFCACTSLKRLDIPASVKDIGRGVFSGIEDISENTVSNACGVETLVVAQDNPIFDSRDNCNAIIRTADNKLITGCKTSVIPDGVRTIADYAFYQTDYSSTYIPESVDSIGRYAFCDSQIGEVLIIPGTVKDLGYATFTSCHNLKKVIVEEGVRELPYIGFYRCKNLQSIHLPSTIEVLYEAADGVFSECPILQEIVVAEGNPTYDSRNNCNGIIRTLTNTLVVGGLNTIIPDEVECIGMDAFSGRNIETIKLPSKLKKIAAVAFASCTQLRSIVIPAGVQFIGDRAFFNNFSLASITSLIEEPWEMNGGAFGPFENSNTGGVGGDNGTVLFVPEGTKEKYERLIPWNMFALIKEFDDVKPVYKRKVVVEEGTGTWCQWCPRGIVGIHSMTEKYPNDFIPIAVHVKDEMMANTYSPLLAQHFSGYPSCTMNRLYHFDPNEADLEYYYQQAIGTSKCNFTMAAYWANEGKDSLIVATNCCFEKNQEDDYRIAYVITENKVGPYPQENAYAGGVNGEMGGFENETKSTLILHDHVARYISKVNGNSRTVPDAPHGGVDYHYNYTLTIPDNIQSIENIEVIALLINQETLEIENADRVLAADIRKYDPNGIGCMTMENDRGEKWGTIDGVILNHAPKKHGIYIKNGKKIVVK